MRKIPYLISALAEFGPFFYLEIARLQNPNTSGVLQDTAAMCCALRCEKRRGDGRGVRGLSCLRGAPHSRCARDSPPSANSPCYSRSIGYRPSYPTTTRLGGIHARGGRDRGREPPAWRRRSAAPRLRTHRPTAKRRAGAAAHGSVGTPGWSMHTDTPARASHLRFRCK